MPTENSQNKTNLKYTSSMNYVTLYLLLIDYNQTALFKTNVLAASVVTEMHWVI